MGQATAEATLGLIETLRSKHAGVVTVRIADTIRDDGDGPPIYLVHLDSPLIDEAMSGAVVEIVLGIGGVRFKVWKDHG